MSNTLERLEYGFDRDSRRTWRRRSLTTGEDYAYGYDRLSQVVNAARGSLNLNATAIGGVAAEAEGWDYDPTGNWKGYRIEENGAVVLDQKRVHDQGNRLTQIEGNLVDGLNPIRVDRVGRMLEVPPDAAGDWEEPLKLEWDAWNRVVLVRREEMVWTYEYDGLFRRVTRSGFAGDRHTYYSDAWRPLEDRDGSATADPNVQYFWGARHRDDLVRRDRATESDGVLNETRYVLMDYFSPAAITDESGEVKERYAFSAFGVRRIMAPDFTPRDASECGLEFAFQGQFEDHESGFLNYGFRYYSPYLGRWLSKDPMGEIVGLNAYIIVDNGPTNIHDFLGLCDLKKVQGLPAPFKQQLCDGLAATLSDEEKRERNGGLYKGRVSGKEYQGETKTGKPAILDANGKPIHATGGQIFKTENFWQQNSFGIPQFAGADIVVDWHTHPDDGNEEQPPSGRDKGRATPGCCYLVVTKKSVWSWDPAKKDYVNLGTPQVVLGCK
jgi:RHS repeat-associated protein